MSLQADGHDIGQLLTYALRLKARPGADGDYAALIARYIDETAFRTAFDAVLNGMHLRVLHAGDLGLVLTARRESPFAYRLAGEPATWTKDKARMLRGIAHLGIAAYTYPHPDDLHDPSVRYVDVLACEDFIRRSCAQLRVRADEVANGAPDVSDRIVDLALAAGVDAAWAEWDQMPAADVASKGRGSGRISSRSAAYWVLRALRDLVDHGLARPVGKENDGRFQILERYRHQVGAAAALEGYQALAALNRADEDRTDAANPGPVTPLPGNPPVWSAAPTTAAGAATDPAADETDDLDDEADIEESA